MCPSHCGLQSVDQCGGAHCIAEVPIAVWSLQCVDISVGVPIACNTAEVLVGSRVWISVEVAIADTMPDQLR